jgi:hypothetical protein
VAGVTALLLSYNPSLTPDDIFDVLTTTALDLGAAGSDTTFGYGLVQAFDALSTGGCIDTDGDGICAGSDNCPSVANPGQEDADGDGDGDACDICPSDPGNDADEDGICAAADNCPGIYNPGQGDEDDDGIGGACDVPEGTIELPRSGQDACYSSSGNQISCGGTGQDGDVGAGVPWPVPRFTNPDGSAPLGEQVAVDRLTGLMWLRDANCVKTFHPEADRNDKNGDGKVFWETAHDVVAGINSGAYWNCGAGYDDWRVPNFNELISLVNAGENNSIEWLEGQGFTGIQSKAYWSSTTTASSSSKAWSLKLKKASAGATKKGSDIYLWPVRGDTTAPAAVGSTGQETNYYPGDDGILAAGVASPQPRFFDGGNSTLTDTLTGLTWAGEGTLAGPSACKPGGKKGWNSALGYAACVNAAVYLGHSDWRVPNVRELLSIMNYGQASVTDWLVSSGFANLPGGKYWTSTTYAGKTSSAWTVEKTGKPKKRPKGKTAYTWLVRGTPPE